MADVSLPLMPGRGYSTTVEKGNFQLNHPAILMERSVALTPLTNSTMRFGGTMEVVPVGIPPRYRRMQGIVNAVNEYFPQADFKMPEKDKIWFGYRPCSADGLPYIGRSKQCSNLLIATGHSMLGMSLGAGTGKLIAQIANEQTPDIDIAPFAPGRFD
jgi:D-amino-acid dehydrogenase